MATESERPTLSEPERGGIAEPWASVDAPLPPDWTADHVALRLVEAFRTLDRLPRVAGPRRAGNHWPQHRMEWADHLAQAELPAAERRERDILRNALASRPDGAAIARMDMALEWLRHLRAIDPGLALVTSLWALRAARRRSLRSLCREKGWAPGTFYKLRTRALETLAATLRAKGTAVF